MIAVVLGCVLAAATVAFAFDDVEPGSYYETPVDWMVDQGITSGTSATTFSPHDPVTRAHLAAFLHRFGGELPGADQSFDDVEEADYFSDAVGWLLLHAITAGVSEDLYGPDQDLTRAQAATFFYRYAGEPEVTGSSGFSDVPDGQWFSDPITWMVDEGITQGTSPSTFSPDDVVTRAQFATFLWRFAGEPAVGEAGSNRQPLSYACGHQTTLDKTECAALVNLFHATNGTEWIDSTGWIATTDPCTWFGITCNFEHLDEVELMDNNLTGTLPTDIGDLGIGLRTLDLSENEIAGQIPGDVATLTGLQRLWLDYNELVGSIPAELGNLTNVGWLYLNSNDLSGPIPPELRDLDQVIYLNLSNNQLTGTIPTELGELPQVQFLQLHSNQLEGTIPTELADIPMLVSLTLSDNQLTGTIPSDLGDIATLRNVYLNSNQLTGSIPASFVTNTQMRVLNVANNQLDGSIPEWPAGHKMAYLIGFGNDFSGSIPASVANLTDLNQFMFHDNDLTGAVPDGLATLTNVTILTLNGQSGCLTASAPTAAWLDSFDSDWNDGCS